MQAVERAGDIQTLKALLAALNLVLVGRMADWRLATVEASPQVLRISVGKPAVSQPRGARHAVSCPIGEQ